MTLELRGGNVSIIKNGIVYGGANNCIRAIVIRAHLGQPVVSDARSLVTFAVGTATENVAFGFLQKVKKETVKQDVAMSEEIIDGVDMCGHADFVEKLPSGAFHIYEHKSISSTNVADKVFHHGKYKPDNLAQLVNYMITAEAETGTLIYTSTIYHTDKKEGFSVKAAQQRAFEVRLFPDFRVYVDDEPAEFTASNVMEFRMRAAEAILNIRLDSPPPTPFENTFFSPCKDCWLAQFCEEFNRDGDTETFFRAVTKELERLGKR